MPVPRDLPMDKIVVSSLGVCQGVVKKQGGVPEGEVGVVSLEGQYGLTKLILVPKGPDVLALPNQVVDAVGLQASAGITLSIPHGKQPILGYNSLGTYVSKNTLVLGPPIRLVLGFEKLLDRIQPRQPIKGGQRIVPTA